MYLYDVPMFSYSLGLFVELPAEATPSAPSRCYPGSLWSTRGDRAFQDHMITIWEAPPKNKHHLVNIWPIYG